MKQLLEADGISLRFNERHILNSVYIKCETGSVTGLLGPNGAGKTCLMNVIYGRLPAESRSIRLNGGYLPNAWKKPKILRYAPQFNFIPGHFKVKRVFADLEVDLSRFCEHFPEFKELSSSRMKHLSGGHRRLVEVYVILCSATDFVMLDEPFSHIMPVHIEKLQEVISVERATKGILVSDHLYREILSVSDHLYFLGDGQVRPVANQEELAALGYLTAGSPIR